MYLDFNNLTGDNEFNSTFCHPRKAIDWISVDCSLVTCSCCGRCGNDCSGPQNHASQNNDSIALRLEINLDEHPEETIWRVRQTLGDETKTFGGEGNCASSNALLVWRVYLYPGDVQFLIFDQGNNGICCEQIFGSYTIYVEYPDGDKLVASSNGIFLTTERQAITILEKSYSFNPEISATNSSLVDSQPYSNLFHL